MPPKSHKKGKNKTSARTKRPAHLFIEVDDGEGWDLIVHTLCDKLELPNLGTRSGLKRIHSNIEPISKQLNDIYDANSTNEYVLGGVVGVWTMMCADAILRTKLFEQGILRKLLPLIGRAKSIDCRRLALRSLNTITHHGGVEIRQEILLHVPTLLEVLQANLSDTSIVENTVSIISHAAMGIVNEQEKPDIKYIKALQVPILLSVVINILRRPPESLSELLIGHATHLLQCLTLHCWENFKADQAALNCIAAFMRSSALFTRCSTLGALARLEVFASEEDMRFSDPRQLIAGVQRGFPPHLQDIMMDYGFDRCETTIILTSTRDHQRAMMEFVQDTTHDFTALGLKLAELVLRNEFAIVEGTFQTQDPRTGRLDRNYDLGLGFTMWSDALPLSAKALRESNKANKEELADILQMKFFMLRRKISQAIAVADRASENGATHPYYYYIITMGSDLHKGLRHAKKGLKCSNMIPFMRFGLMQRAVDIAGNLGITQIDSGPDDSAREEGVAFLMSAFDDAKTYVAEAPPDARHMKTVVYWYVALLVAITGPALSLDLRELEEPLKKLKVAEEIGTLLGNSPKNTQMRLTSQTIRKHYAVAQKDWAGLVERLDGLTGHTEDEQSSAPPLDPAAAEDDFASWLEGLKIGDKSKESTYIPPTCTTHPKVSPNRVALYRCAHCGNPSAVLRKCSGCTAARYCDAKCQSSHWSAHKRTCKPHVT